MLTFPRLLGGLVLLWGLRAIPEAFITGQIFWAANGFLWLCAAGFLLKMRHVRLASIGVVILIGVEFFVRVPQLTGLELLAWIALIVAVTEGRPADRALLLRTCVTVVYSFAVLTKLNPSWLEGEGIAGLIIRRPQLAGLAFLAESPLLSTAAAVLVIALEGWLAIGLWRKRTRVATAVLGLVMHSAFVILASPNLWAGVHLTVFNFGLVACYPAFWAAIRREPASVQAAQPAATNSFVTNSDPT